MTDDLLLERYLADVAKQRSASTTRVARIHLAGFRHFLADRDRTLLDAIEEDFRDFVADRYASGATHKSISSKYSHIRLFYGWCVQEGMIPINVAAGVTIPNGESTRAIPTADEIDCLFSYADEQIKVNGGNRQALRLALRMKAWLHLLVETAAYPGEIAPLLLDDLDEERRAVRLGRDTSRDRVRSLSPKGWAVLIRYRKATVIRCSSREGYLFPAGKGRSSGCLSVDQVSYAVATLGRDAGLHAPITPTALSRVSVRELQGAVSETVGRAAIARKTLGAAVIAKPEMDVAALRQALERWHPFGRL
jgi:site-specific recombinase XerD